MANNNINPTSAANSAILAGVIQLKIRDKTFFVSKALLEQHAPNFPLNITELKDVSPRTFEAFLHSIGIKRDGSEWKNMPSGPWYIVKPLCEVFMFGVKYDIPALRKDTLYRIARNIAAAAKIPNVTGLGVLLARAYASAAIRYAYANTEPSSPLRKILVGGFCTTSLPRDTSDNWLQWFPPEFLHDVLYRKFELTSNEESRKEALECLEE